MSKKSLKCSKLLTKVKKNKEKCWIEVTVELINKNNEFFLEMEEFDSGTNAQPVEDIYEMPDISESAGNGNMNGNKPYEPLKFSVNLSLYKSCFIKKSIKTADQLTSKDKQLNIITIQSGLLGRSLKKIYIGTQSVTEAEEWYDILKSKFNNKLNRFSSFKKTKKEQPPNVNLDFDLIDNDVYEKTATNSPYFATVIDTDKSKEMHFHGNYQLTVGVETLDLLHPKTGLIQHQWNIKSIRKFGVKNDILKVEVGTASAGGEGTYIFTVQKASEFLEALLAAKQRLQRQMATSVPTSAPPSMMALSNEFVKTHSRNLSTPIDNLSGDDTYSEVNLIKKQQDRGLPSLSLSVRDNNRHSPSPPPPPVPVPVYAIGDTEVQDNAHKTFAGNAAYELGYEDDDAYETLGDTVPKPDSEFASESSLNDESEHLPVSLPLSQPSSHESNNCTNPEYMLNE